MDYVPAHGDTARKDDREDLGGARAFDGEDQGMYLIARHDSNLFNFVIDTFSFFFRLRK